MEHTRLILIDFDHPVLATDIGCDDWQGAALNRERIAKQVSTVWWDLMERVRDNTPLESTLPEWIPSDRIKK